MGKAVVATSPGLPGGCDTITSVVGMVKGRGTEMLKVNAEFRSTDSVRGIT